jgi:hypothetical protein
VRVPKTRRMSDQHVAPGIYLGIWLTAATSAFWRPLCLPSCKCKRIKLGVNLPRELDTSNTCRDVWEMGFPLLPHASLGHARPHYGVNSSRVISILSSAHVELPGRLNLHRASCPCLQLAANQKVFLVASSQTTFDFSPGLPTLPRHPCLGLRHYSCLHMPSSLRQCSEHPHRLDTQTTSLGQMTSRKSACAALPVDLKTET